MQASMPNPIDSSKPKTSLLKKVSKGNKGGSYQEMTLIEDVIEANKYIGEHIDSLTRRTTLIQEHLSPIHPNLSLRLIRRILTKDSDKA
jgi:hypothetical protein